jgi:hypothetical protein
MRKNVLLDTVTYKLPENGKSIRYYRKDTSGIRENGGIRKSIEEIAALNFYIVIQ